MSEVVKCPNCGTAIFIQTETSSYQTQYKNIFEAAKSGIVKDVAYFIENGTDVNAISPYYNPNDRLNIPLQFAIRYNTNIKVVEYLLSKGADVNFLTGSETSPLSLALTYKRNEIEVIKLLISQGVDVNASEKRSPPLHEAIKSHNFQAVQLLVSNGADVCVKNSGGGIPILLAVGQGNIELVQFLVSHGADIHVKDPGTHTTILSSATHVVMAKFLVSQGVECSDDDRKAAYNRLKRYEKNENMVKDVKKMYEDVYKFFEDSISNKK